MPETGKPSNEVDKAVVTLSEIEYNRLIAIEDNVKELFRKARDVTGFVGIGKVPKEGYEEIKIVKELRNLTGIH